MYSWEMLLQSLCQDVTLAVLFMGKEKKYIVFKARNLTDSVIENLAV